jgi:hypothetical protein
MKTLAALLAATALALAPPAGAWTNNLAVQHVPVLQGVQVTITDTTPNPGPAIGVRQLGERVPCTYDSVSLGGLGSLVPPTHHDFLLPELGQAQFILPGLPTGTQWKVSIYCHGHDNHGGALSTGSYDEVVTY